jgi:single-stranded DNA-binding protein
MGVIVVGTLDQRSWEDKEGAKRSTVEVKAMDIGIRTGALESVERRKAQQGGDSAKSGPKRTKETVPADEPF